MATRPSARNERVAPNARLTYVDWLRVLAVGGVFLIHVCEVFNPWDEWHITNEVRSRVLGEVVVLMAPWLMPLLMLLAGVSAWFSLMSRTNGRYLLERITRVLVPLVLGTLLLVPVQVWLERRWRGQFHGSLLAFYPRFFEGIYPRGNLSWHHLWFLAHLFAYSIIALPLFRYLSSSRGHHRLRWLARISGGPGGLFWLSLPLLLERSLLWGLFPERHMLGSDWSNHALLFIAYVYGFILAGEPWLGARIDAEWPRALVAGVASTSSLVILTWMDIVPFRLPAAYSVPYLAFWTLYAIGAWSWMVAVLGVARRLLRAEDAALRYGREIGYGWYLAHQPVIVAVAVLVVPWHASVPAKAGILLAVSFAGTLGITELLRRVQPLGLALGMRPVDDPRPAGSVCTRVTT